MSQQVESQKVIEEVNNNKQNNEQKNQISLDIRKCVKYVDNEQNIKGIVADLSISRSQYSVNLPKLCSGDILCYLDQELFCSLYNQCLSEVVPHEFSNNIRFVDYKGNRIKDMPRNRTNNNMPDLPKSHISGIPKKLSEITVPVQRETTEDFVIIPITRSYKTLGLMSLNRKMNLMQELSNLRLKFENSKVWLLVDKQQIEEFKTILTSDYDFVMSQFDHIESISQDMSLCIVECIFGRNFHDTKPADDYVEIMFHQSSYINSIKVIDCKSIDPVLANVRNNNSGIRISVTKYPTQNVKVLIQGQIQFISEDLPFDVKQGLIQFQNTEYHQFKLQDNKKLQFLLGLHANVQKQEELTETAVKGSEIQVKSFDNVIDYMYEYSQLISEQNTEDDTQNLYTLMFLDYFYNLERLQKIVNEYLLLKIRKTLFSGNKIQVQVNSLQPNLMNVKSYVPRVKSLEQ